MSRRYALVELPLELPDELGKTEIKSTADGSNFDDIKTPLGPLILADVRLVGAHPTSQVCLREPCRNTLVTKTLHQNKVSCVMDAFDPRFRHGCEQYSRMIEYANLAYSSLASLIKDKSIATCFDSLVTEFCDSLGVQWTPPDDLATASATAIAACGGEEGLREDIGRSSLLFGLVNQKFGFNDSLFQSLLNRAAERNRILNYHEKVRLRSAIDFSDEVAFTNWTREVGVGPDLPHVTALPEPAETLRKFHEQLVAPTIARSDARNCDVSERREAIFRSLFSSFVFRSFPVERMHAHFDLNSREKYIPDFYEHLLSYYPSFLRRECSLFLLELRTADVLRPTIYDDVCGFIEDAYRRLSNHCYLAVLLQSSTDERCVEEDAQWRLFSDIILFAEKFRETPLATGYFQSARIAATTSAYIPDLQADKAKFHLANEGFFFRDAFILLHRAETTTAPYDILLLFEKNERDERPLPCPACRSIDVRGNSYPVLGVKSWECQNMLCPERSAFDRGNRYSLAGLIKQRAIGSEADQIPLSSLRRWKLDVVPSPTQREVVEMLVRHFTLHGDTAILVNTAHHGEDIVGRKLRYQTLEKAAEPRYTRFQASSFFSRFVVERTKNASETWQLIPSRCSDADVYLGDAWNVLLDLPPCSVDGAVTSPPYYNARSYSVWPNIYCYLYDMYNVALQVHRVLRPGAYFLFNIFDYFDNENTMVLSAMGKKRMILGAYIINLFRRAGFFVEGNTVWYKGEIEGKRNFNQGNRSPYYQFPLNCWEHVLTFRKPGSGDALKFPFVLAARPVIKMVRGRNTLGHSAPFPEQIPELLISQLQRGDQVLDPFAGSMTTARVAKRHDIRSISIDVHLEYCQLGIELLDQVNSTAPLFDDSQRRD